MKLDRAGSVPAALAALALLAFPSGCGEAEAAPLRVTYYYLPG